MYPGRARVNFYDTFLLCREDFELQLVVLDRLLKATTKKVHLQTKSYEWDCGGEKVRNLVASFDPDPVDFKGVLVSK